MNNKNNNKLNPLTKCPHLFRSSTLRVIQKRGSSHGCLKIYWSICGIGRKLNLFFFFLVNAKREREDGGKRKRKRNKSISIFHSFTHKEPWRAISSFPNDLLLPFPHMVFCLKARRGVCLSPFLCFQRDTKHRAVKNQLFILLQQQVVVQGGKFNDTESSNRKAAKTY